MRSELSYFLRVVSYGSSSLMKALTFGWEFPPEATGGLGIACHGLVQELVSLGVEVIFVLPKRQTVSGPARFIFADIIKGSIKATNYSYGVGPYSQSETILYEIPTISPVGSVTYRRLIDAVYAFARAAERIAKEEEFDVIHAHDWTSYLAGVAAKRVSGKPLVLHVHATSFDQAGSNNVDPTIYQIEKEAFALADQIVTVSNFTRSLILDKHQAPPARVEVVYNGTDTNEPYHHSPTLSELKAQGKRIVLYHGRITIQKGVDHLITAARLVIDTDPEVVFVISGSGDMETQIMQQVGALGLSSHILFAGALWGEERDRMYQSADLVVMPSVSEPFGLVPLEAMRHGTPALISKQSGVAEVVSHVLKVDFWDMEEMANKILAALRYPVLHQQLTREGKSELKGLSWSGAAEKVRALYARLLQWAESQAI